MHRRTVPRVRGARVPAQRSGSVPGDVARAPSLYYSLLMDTAELMKALADPNRLRILNLLHEKTLCVCDLEAILGLNQSNLSRHLAKLRQAGLVTPQKKALFTYYSRAKVPGPYGEVVESLCEAVHADPAWEKDRARLAKRLQACDGCC